MKLNACRLPRVLPLLLAGVWLGAPAAHAQTNTAEVYNVYSSGSTGADGEFNPRFEVINGTNTLVGVPPGTRFAQRIEASSFAQGRTNVDIALNSSGVYNFTTIVVPSWAFVRFVPNTGNTPVVWLASGDVNVNGDISVAAKDTVNAIYGGNDEYRDPFGSTDITRPGPGGYPGGAIGATGYGPNGGLGGSSPKPGAEAGLILPFNGGSGGGGSYSYLGGGGGGVLCIASSTKIFSQAGRVFLRGRDISYSGRGGDGLVALIANGAYPISLSASSSRTAKALLLTFRALANNSDYLQLLPPFPVGTTSGALPVARVASIGTFAIPDSVTGATTPYVARVPLSGTQTVTLETRNLPVSILFDVLFTKGGVTTTNRFPATTGTSASATTSGTYDFGTGTTTISALATAPVQTALAPRWQGRGLKEVQIALNPEGRSITQFITESGDVLSHEAALRLAVRQGKWEFIRQYGGS